MGNAPAISPVDISERDGSSGSGVGRGTLLGIRADGSVGTPLVRFAQTARTQPNASSLLHAINNEGVAQFGWQWIEFSADFFESPDVSSWAKLLEAGSLSEARGKGWLRSEGKEYVVEEGDVMEFLFNV